MNPVDVVQISSTPWTTAEAVFAAVFLLAVLGAICYQFFISKSGRGIWKELFSRPLTMRAVGFYVGTALAVFFYKSVLYSFSVSLIIAYPVWVYILALVPLKTTGYFVDFLSIILFALAPFTWSYLFSLFKRSKLFMALFVISAASFLVWLWLASMQATML